MHAPRLAVAALLALAGCSHYWAAPGGTREAFGAAKARCESDAFAHYPPVSRFGLDQEIIAPEPDLCVSGARDHMLCMSNGGKFVAPSFPGYGMSEPARGLFASCMRAAGWQPVQNAQEGDAVTKGLPRAHSGG